MIYDECLFVFIWSLGSSRINLTFRGAGDGVPKVRYPGTTSLYDWSPIRILETKVWESFSGGQHFVHYHILLLGELSIVHETPLKKTIGIFCLVSSELCPMLFYSLLILICIFSMQKIISMSKSVLPGSLRPHKLSNLTVSCGCHTDHQITSFGEL